MRRVVSKWAVFALVCSTAACNEESLPTISEIDGGGIALQDCTGSSVWCDSPGVVAPGIGSASSGGSSAAGRASGCTAPSPTGFCFRSTKDDAIGRGESVTIGAPELYVARRLGEGPAGFTLDGTGSFGRYFLHFHAKSTDALRRGSYPNAIRYPDNGSYGPGLYVSNLARGCSTVTGSFQVFELQLDAYGQVESFGANFVQHCDGRGTLRGQFRYNSGTGAP